MCDLECWRIKAPTACSSFIGFWITHGVGLWILSPSNCFWVVDFFGGLVFYIQGVWFTG